MLQAGEPYTAVQVFKQIQQAGLTPNYVTYSGLIAALGKVRKRGQPSAELAYQLWQELYELRQPLDAAAYRTGVHSSVYAVAVQTGDSSALCVAIHFLYQVSHQALSMHVTVMCPTLPGIIGGTQFIRVQCCETFCKMWSAIL